ncbi:hypothetical protein WICPIJ_006716, partial [Wickerhamomyces pijperi]
MIATAPPTTPPTTRPTILLDDFLVALEDEDVDVEEGEDLFVVVLTTEVTTLGFKSIVE